MRLKEDFGVRALLAVIVVATGMLALFVLTIRGSEEALRYIGELVLVVAAFYFGLRIKGEGSK